jgi:hypothetical protein
MSIEKLRALNIEKIDIDEAVSMVQFGRALRDTYLSFKVEPPEWVKDALGALELDVTRRRNDMLAMRLKEVRAKKAALRTRAEQVSDLDAEERRLTDALGQ